MQELVTTRFSNEFLALCGMGLGLVAIVGVIITTTAIIYAVYKRKTQLDDMEATIKMEMIQRGMSAEEIERVLHAKMGTPQAKSLANLFDAIAAARRNRATGQKAEQA
ncbi:MAG TPA: hypothetical protein VGZ26_12030 [Pirellulales bacterium]|jgi:hypothetical protein|nr:hypothetical protein [Pirellulales bacterium]